jgi:hypothetical protein
VDVSVFDIGGTKFCRSSLHSPECPTNVAASAVSFSLPFIAENLASVEAMVVSPSVLFIAENNSSGAASAVSSPLHFIAENVASVGGSGAASVPDLMLSSLAWVNKLIP